MGKRIVIVGAGAVGGYVGGHLARAGQDVRLFDPWPEHVETINASGLCLEGTQGEHVVQVPAMHLHEMQAMSQAPADIAILCTKSFDTEWAARAVLQYLTPDGFLEKPVDPAIDFREGKLRNGIGQLEEIQLSQMNETTHLCRII